MILASQESLELEAQRSEVETVLQSKPFTRAPTLAHLLSYLCETLFAGKASEIKEYSIGIEVFHRGTSFDQDSDSIVRVEANRLRKRLADYYASEGASHPLHITIPLGQYVPKFVRHTPQPAPPTAPAVVHVPPSPQVENRRHWSHFLSGRRIAWLAGSLAVLMAGVGAVRLLVREQPAAMQPLASQPHAALSGSIKSDPLVGPPIGDEVRVLAGAGRSFVDHAGKLWSADSWFFGGTAVKSSVQHIWRTQDPDFYRTSRQGQFRYEIPLTKGIYELRLHFAETVYGPESTGTGGEGSRILSVRINGKPLLVHFDVVADAGASRTADVKVFPDVTPATDGMLHLEFVPESGGQATLSAIEILPGMRGQMRPVRLLTRQTPYYSNDSHWWSPDSYFEGGQLASYTTPVTGTDEPELYEAERWGNFSYAIPVSPGRYALTLHFAARRGDWPSPVQDGKAATAHVFNVFCNGKVLLQKFDLAKEARQADVVIRRASGLEPNAQGKLFLSFVPVEGYATVTGIEVLPQ